MLLAEEILGCGTSIEVKIFATDASLKSLEVAPPACSGSIEGDMSLEASTGSLEGRARIPDPQADPRHGGVRSQNVLRDPPFSHVDICTCRNLLIFSSPTCRSACWRCCISRSSMVARCSSALRKLGLAEGRVRDARPQASHLPPHRAARPSSPELPAFAARMIARRPGSHRTAASGNYVAVQQALF